MVSLAGFGCGVCFNFAHAKLPAARSSGYLKIVSASLGIEVGDYRQCEVGKVSGRHRVGFANSIESNSFVAREFLDIRAIRDLVK